MFQWLIVHTAAAAALAVVVAAVCRWFRPGPAFRHLLWLVVLIKLLTPPVVVCPLPAPRYGAPATAPAVAATRTVIIDEEPAEADGAPTPDSPPADALVVPAAPAPAEAAPAAPPVSWDWLAAAPAWLWLAGGVLVALRNGVRIGRWQRRLAGAAPAPEWLAAQVRELAGAMGVRPPRLAVLPGAGSPMIWCFGAPRLIWPLGLEDRLSAEGRRAVLWHELAHVRRRDHWVGWLLLAGACLWWWHPLFWWVRRRLTLEAELACDAWVVGAAPDGRRAYAEALLEVSQRLSRAAAVPALGAASGRRDLERRLVMIMRGPAARRLSWVGLAGVGALGLLALPAWTLGDDPKAPPPTPSVRPIEAAPPAPVAVDAAAPAVAAPAPGTPVRYYEPITTYRAVTTYQPVTSYRVVQTTTADGDAPERDKKIKELEDRVEQLLKELHSLRGEGPAAAPAQRGQPVTTGEALVDYLTRSATVRVAPGAPGGMPPTAAESPGEVVTLTRVTYKLKPQTAEALGALLKENVKTAVLETKTEGDNLTVTTTPEAQHAIGQFIGLIQGKGPPSPSGTSGMPPVPGATFTPRPGGTIIGTPPPGGTSPYTPPGPGGTSLRPLAPGGTSPAPSPGGTSGPPNPTPPGGTSPGQ